MSKTNPHHPSLRPIFGAYQTIVTTDSYKLFDATVHAQLDHTDIEPELDFFFERAIQLAAYLGDEPTEFLCDGAALACEELAKEAVMIYLHLHPNISIQTPNHSLEIHASDDHQLSITSELQITSVANIPNEVWVELFQAMPHEQAA